MPYLRHVMRGAACDFAVLESTYGGKIRDAGITDANNMGAAMAPAAYETLKAHFADTGRTPDYYDLIVTGDLGKIGHTVVTRLFQNDGIELEGLYTDCGLLIYDLEGQDVHAGGSGCGCSAITLCGLHDAEATSLSRECGDDSLSMQEVKDVCTREFQTLFADPPVAPC